MSLNHLLHIKNGYTDSGIGLDWEKKIIGESVSANEEATDTFTAELKKLSRKVYVHSKLVLSIINKFCDFNQNDV